MGRKIYWSITDKQQEEAEKFFRVNKMDATVEDMIIDNMELLAKNIDPVFDKLIEEKQMTKKDFDAEQLPYIGKLPKQKKEFKLKVVVLTGEKIFNGLTKSGKINNFMNRKDGKVTHKTLDEFVNAYMQNEFHKISAWIENYEINEESRRSKEETKKDSQPKKELKPESST